MAAASATAVLEHIARVQAQIPAVEQLQRDAEAVAGEHGHELGEWHATTHLLTAAKCQHCTATVCLRTDGHGSNSDPLVYLRDRECRPVLPRYQVRKITSPTIYLVVDTENPRRAAVAMRRKATTAQKLADARNGAVVKDPAVVLRAKVARLRKQLAKAESDLAALAPREVTVQGRRLTLITDAQSQPDGSQIPAQATDPDGNVYYLGAEQIAA